MNLFGPDPMLHDATHQRDDLCGRLLDQFELPDGSYNYSARRCQQNATRYVCRDDSSLSSDNGEIRITGTVYERLCEAHHAEIRTDPQFRYSQVLSDLLGGAS